MFGVNGLETVLDFPQFHGGSTAADVTAKDEDPK